VTVRLFHLLVFLVAVLVAALLAVLQRTFA
jgi:hypothetical protein